MSFARLFIPEVNRDASNASLSTIPMKSEVLKFDYQSAHAIEKVTRLLDTIPSNNGIYYTSVILAATLEAVIAYGLAPVAKLNYPLIAILYHQISELRWMTLIVGLTIFSGLHYEKQEKFAKVNYILGRHQKKWLEVLAPLSESNDQFEQVLKESTLLEIHGFLRQGLKLKQEEIRKKILRRDLSYEEQCVLTPHRQGPKHWP